MKPSQLPLELTNVVEATPKIMLTHVFACHEEMSKLKIELTALRADKVRLDAMENLQLHVARPASIAEWCVWRTSEGGHHYAKTVRAAIDAAIDAAKENR